MIINVSQVHYGGQLVREAVKAGWVVVSPHIYEVTVEQGVSPWGTYIIEEATNLAVGAIEALHNVLTNNIVICEGNTTLCDLEEVNKLLSTVVVVIS